MTINLKDALQLVQAAALDARLNKNKVKVTINREALEVVLKAYETALASNKRLDEKNAKLGRELEEAKAAIDRLVVHGAATSAELDAYRTEKVGHPADGM